MQTPCATPVNALAPFSRPDAELRSVVIDRTRGVIRPIELSSIELPGDTCAVAMEGTVDRLQGMYAASANAAAHWAVTPKFGTTYHSQRWRFAS